MRLLAQFRAGAMQEALAQRNGIIGYFRALLQFNLQTHPYTYYLAASALRVGQFLCMYYKDKFNRPRPVRLDPSIFSDRPARAPFLPERPRDSVVSDSALSRAGGAEVAGHGTPKRR